MNYKELPWVAPFTHWLETQGPEALTIIMVMIGIITILVGLLAPTSIKILLGVYLLAP